MVGNRHLYYAGQEPNENILNQNSVITGYLIQVFIILCNVIGRRVRGEKINNNHYQMFYCWRLIITIVGLQFGENCRFQWHFPNACVTQTTYSTTDPFSYERKNYLTVRKNKRKKERKKRREREKEGRRETSETG